jgi:hypothetical protein
MVAFLTCRLQIDDQGAAGVVRIRTRPDEATQERRLRGSLAIAVFPFCNLGDSDLMLGLRCFRCWSLFPLVCSNRLP